MTREISTHAHEVETDVLVIGGGGTGLAAAVSAAEEGAEVTVAEKCSALGGTTGLSIGSITACCTSYQARQGIVDSPEALFEDMKKFNGELDRYDNKELCWILIREGAQTIEWLRQHGFEFYGPSPEPPHRVPRMHNVIPNALSYPGLLRRAAIKKGVKILLNTSGRKLIQEDGRITGALLEETRKNVSIKVHARRAVILASGDYSNSVILKERYLSADLAKAPGYNSDCQGEGHVMGMEVGGRTVNMGVFTQPNVRFVPARKKIWNELLPSHPLLIKLYAAGSKLLPRRVFMRLASQILTTRGAPNEGLYREGAILVNREGSRFTNELKDPSFPIARQPGGETYIVFDSRLARKFSAWPYFVSTAAGMAYAYVRDYEKDVPDIVSKGNTLEEAAKIHPKPSVLVQTVRRYNHFVQSGRDEDFQRTPMGEGILTPPFYVMGPAVGYIGVTIGGLDINTRFQVLDQSGKVIPGLFAGGRTAGGLILMGHGLNLAWAFTSGRLAGKVAAGSV
ncbi:MAG TPA: FAD-dependent oxidoreductase [Thermodesulfobacteriota bacterium]|nr:FAD-dependent oxidoreductase [Thermodesulfobacteriota bacterium]